MAGAFNGHPIDPSNTSMASSSMFFNTSMHGTPANQSFSMFGTQNSMFAEQSEETAMKIAHLQAKLHQKLGPEFISQRPGGGGLRLTYAEGWKIINLANEVFGFNGWSTSVVNLTTDFIDASEGGTKFNISVTAIVRVTLRDGVFHEDVGCGTIENTKSKAQGLDKCKKEAVTDAVKRALRNFGNLMGNCLYDKSYTQEVVKIKVPPAKFDKTQLHRRPEFEEPGTSGATASTSAGGSTGNSYAANTSKPSFQQPQGPQQRGGNTGPVHIKTESHSSSMAVGPQNRNNSTYDPKGKAPQRPMQSHTPAPANPIPAPPANPVPEPKADTGRRVSFASTTAPPAVAAASSSTVGTTSSDANADMAGSDPYAVFSDDDALFASVCLVDLGRPISADADMGPPINADTDVGRPLEYPDESTGSVGPPPPPPVQEAANPQGRAKRLAELIAAGLEQDKQSTAGGSNSSSTSGRITLPPGQRSSFPGASGENRNPSGQYEQKGGKPPLPMGGFQFPAGVSNPLQSSNGHNSGMGTKRPAEMMSNGSRSSHPGMGLQQALQHSANGRQAYHDAGDAKRMRR